MTKKDFELIARVLGTEHALRDVEDNKKGKAAVESVAREFAHRLSSTNDRFDAGRFLRACGIQA